MKIRILFSVITALFITTVPTYSQDISNYLIQQDIGEYKYRPNRVVTIGNAGVLVPTGHFPGHGDTSCEGIYIHPQTYLGVTVQLTQHSGSDSDKWLLHEVEDGYRDPDVLEADWTQGARVREIEGNLIFGVRGSGYTWLSGSRVVNIEYTDLIGTKPEPLEIVKAYLAKFPSSITLTDADAKSTAHSTTWLKDEISRRLWLADKWVAQIVADDPKLKDKLDDVVKHLKVFLNYKEKYFGISEEEKAAGITAKSEQKALNIYLQQKDTDSIKKKLTAYKTWWTAHKGDAINL